jgi:uncharacterized protein YebE (UPF0316 family)
VEILLGALVIFGLRLCDVTLGTVRLIVSIQGRRFLAAGIAFVEVTIFVVAIGKVLGELDNVYNVFAYSGGFACGTITGIYVEGKLALGTRVVRVITHRPNDALVAQLRGAGFAVTRLLGEGRDGTVYILLSVVPRRTLGRYLAMVRQLAPKAFVTTEEVRDTVHGYMPAFGKRK